MLGYRIMVKKIVTTIAQRLMCQIFLHGDEADSDSYRD